MTHTSSPRDATERGKPKSRRDRLVHLFFDISLFVKGFDGVVQLAGGGLMLALSSGQLAHLAQVLTRSTLTADPHDWVANYLLRSGEQLTDSERVFGGLYLLWHGVVKVGLVIALLKKLAWAYPVAMVAFFLFLVYQLYRYSHTHSIELLVLSVLDVAVIVLTWLEYQRLLRVHALV